MRREGQGLRLRIFLLYGFNREAFLQHFHKRSNSETVFSMAKGQIGDAVRSKGDTGQINEVLWKVLCHNICVLVQSMHEFGIRVALAPTPPQVIGVS